MGGGTADAASAEEVFPELELVGLRKSFDGVTAVQDCSLEISRGEIVALLGASGCGKSTLLNLVAGFHQPDAGTIRLRGRLLNDAPPNLRNVAMVFQHYALFPHLTVDENIGYGPSVRRLDGQTIRARVDEMVSLLHLTGLERRYPAQLSGGQRQRVAVARALAVRPEILLLDEAFSALDRNLREEMQLELSLLLHRLGVSTILVTHDQREAFALADRIAVMDGGRIAQVGSPREIYEQPSNSHVLRFLGSTNSLHAVLARDADGLRASVGGLVEFACPAISAKGLREGVATVYIRAEDLNLSSQPTSVHRSQPARVTLATFLGAYERFVVALGDQQVVIERPAQSGAGKPPFVLGQSVFLDFDAIRCRMAQDA